MLLFLAVSLVLGNPLTLALDLSLALPLNLKLALPVALPAALQGTPARKFLQGKSSKEIPARKVQ